jgi:hypothetical protein
MQSAVLDTVYVYTDLYSMHVLKSFPPIYNMQSINVKHVSSLFKSRIISFVMNVCVSIDVISVKGGYKKKKISCKHFIIYMHNILWLLNFWYNIILCFFELLSFKINNIVVFCQYNLYTPRQLY